MRIVNSLLFVFEFLFYNIIPIGYLSLIHYYNFKEDESLAPRLLQVSNTGSVAHIDETTFSESNGGILRWLIHVPAINVQFFVGKTIFYAVRRNPRLPP